MIKKIWEECIDDWRETAHVLGENFNFCSFLKSCLILIVGIISCFALYIVINLLLLRISGHHELGLGVNNAIIILSFILSFRFVMMLLFLLDKKDVVKHDEDEKRNEKLLFRTLVFGVLFFGVASFGIDSLFECKKDGCPWSNVTLQFLLFYAVFAAVFSRLEKPSRKKNKDEN